MTLDQARQEAQKRSRTGTTWMVTRRLGEGEAYQAERYAELSEGVDCLAVFHAGEELPLQVPEEKGKGSDRKI